MRIEIKIHPNCSEWDDYQEDMTPRRMNLGMSVEQMTSEAKEIRVMCRCGGTTVLQTSSLLTPDKVVWKGICPACGAYFTMEKVENPDGIRLHEAEPSGIIP